MTDFPENEKLSSAEELVDEANIKDEYDEFETIFGDPEAHKDEKKRNSKNGKKRIMSLIAAFLAVAILVGGTVTIIKLIPEKEDETVDTGYEDITVLDYDSDKFSTVSVTNSNGTFKFYSETTATPSTSSDEKASTETLWYLDGLDKSLVSSSHLNLIVSAAASIKASREITTKTASECGFDAPTYKVDVESHEYGNYSVLVGAKSPDNIGVYLKLSTNEKIYIVESNAVSDFDFEKLDLASTASLAGITVPADATGYKDENGSLISFDNVVVSGTQFPETVEIVPTTDESELASYAAFNVIKPSAHIAENIEGLTNLFGNGLSVSGAYSFDVSAASLKAVGLDNPDIVVTMKIKGASRTFKMSRVDNDTFAVIANDSKMIHKVAASSVAFADFTAHDFYASWVYLRSINDISNMNFEVDGTSYSFDIKYDSAEDAEETYIIHHNSNKLVAENFQDFYQIFIGLAASDFDVDKNLGGSPSLKVTVTFTADGSKETIEFTKCSETKYQYSVNGVPMGKITAAAYNKVIKNLKLISEGKEVVN